MSSSGTPISSLPAAVTPLGGAEVFAGVQAGSTVKIPITAVVLGPDTSTDSHLASYDGVDGNKLKDSGIAPGPYAGAALGQLPGTATDDNAAAGKVGEYISATVLVAAAVSLTSTMNADITSISLTAGDWDVSGNVITTAAGSTVTVSLLGWIAEVSATVPTLPNGGAFFALEYTAAAGNNEASPVGMTRLSLATTTTVYLSTQATFSGSTLKAYGFIGARRAR